MEVHAVAAVDWAMLSVLALQAVAEVDCVGQYELAGHTKALVPGSPKKPAPRTQRAQ